MEISSPFKEHETVARVVVLLVVLIAAEIDLDVESAGSKPFKREDLARGFEPDECFYFTNFEIVRGKGDVNLNAADPPPDLDFAADVTDPSLNKLPIYAAGRRGGLALRRRAAGILSRNSLGNGYEAVAGSAFLPFLAGADLTRFGHEGLTTRRPTPDEGVRDWTRRNRHEGPSEAG